MSDLRQAVSGYLAMRRALGFSLVREGQWLMDFADYTAVAIVVGALAWIRQRGAEAVVSPPSSGAYRVLDRAAPTPC